LDFLKICGVEKRVSRRIYHTQSGTVFISSGGLSSKSLKDLCDAQGTPDVGAARPSHHICHGKPEFFGYTLQLLSFSPCDWHYLSLLILINVQLNYT
jgi:hypothetical protein